MPLKILAKFEPNKSIFWSLVTVLYLPPGYAPMALPKASA